MKEFFFDTANLQFIKETTEKIENKINFKLVKGVTTNPNAFSKINQFNLNEWIETAIKISEYISELRNDNEGEIHIQLPYSKFNPDTAIKFAELISGICPEKIRVGMKIPPFTQILKFTEDLNKIVLTNVTGVSDHATALKCISYGVNYVSVIPGRMEEVGIKAVDQISYLFSSNHKSTKIISGSMRTLEQLIYTFQLNTIPTIGERVWPILLEGSNLDNILNIDYDKNFHETQFSPTIDEKSKNLSESFFLQMDELGEKARKEFESQL